jgi:hypothetical protein
LCQLIFQKKVFLFLIADEDDDEVDDDEVLDDDESDELDEEEEFGEYPPGKWLSFALLMDGLISTCVSYIHGEAMRYILCIGRFGFAMFWIFEILQFDRKIR